MLLKQPPTPVERESEGFSSRHVRLGSHSGMGDTARRSRAFRLPKRNNLALRSGA
jgi:hypothetical protein